MMCDEKTIEVTDDRDRRIAELEAENARFRREIICEECGAEKTLLDVICWPCHDKVARKQAEEAN